MEVLPEERDRKYYADNYSCCPPPLFMIFVTLVEVSEPINWQLILYYILFCGVRFVFWGGLWGDLAFSLSFVATDDHRQLMPANRPSVGYEEDDDDAWAMNATLDYYYYYDDMVGRLASCISIERHSRRQQIGYSRLISHLIRNDHDKSCSSPQQWKRGGKEVGQGTHWIVISDRALRDQQELRGAHAVMIHCHWHDSWRGGGSGLFCCIIIGLMET